MKLLTMTLVLPDIFMSPGRQLFLRANKSVLQTFSLTTHGHGQH